MKSLTSSSSAFFGTKRVHHAVLVVDRTLDVGEAVAVGRDHLGIAVAEDELRTREREPRLLVGDRERGVADEIAERLGRQLHRRDLELRDLGELFPAHAGEAEVGAAALHRHPFVVVLFEMNVAGIKCTDDVEQLAGLDAHRTGR